MTEEEAATTQCCGPDGCGHYNTDPWPARWCVGSKCMAWRVRKFDGNADKIAAIKEHRRVHGSDLLTAKNAIEAQWAPGGAQGFCGLAGTPQ